MRWEYGKNHMNSVNLSRWYFFLQGGLPQYHGKRNQAQILAEMWNNLAQRGLHNIEKEIEFEGNSKIIAHDSEGFEVGN